MKVTLKRSELPALQSRLAANLENYKGAKLAYAVAKNLRILQQEISLVQATQQPSEAFYEYDGKRKRLCIEFAEKEEDGTPKIADRRYSIQPDLEAAFSKEMDALQEEYHEAIQERTAQLEDAEKFLEEQDEFEFHAIREDSLTDDLNAELISLILPFIE